MELDFSIRPGVSPDDRQDLEDAMEQALGEGATCTGGGGMLDGSESDFQIELATEVPVSKVVELCKRGLHDLGVLSTFRVEVKVRLGQNEPEVYCLT